MTEDAAPQPGDPRIDRAERVVAAINVVKWILVLAVALGTGVLALLFSLDAFGPDEARGAEYAVTGPGGDVLRDYEDYVEPYDVPEPTSAATRFAQVVLVVAGGSLQALLVWIVLGWAQHTLAMLALIARRRV